ncbi:MAG: hypothetical protein E6K43_03225 [Gammaproteobacteria bacterium]|nr:MAG: hypothetical protein E6K43_03225 [Gammaproteobacteria bacterium]
MTRTRTTAGVTAAGALSLLAGTAVAAPKPADLQLSAGARVAVVNLLDAEVTHFHASRHVQNSFLKTYTVGWPVNAMLMEALRERLAQMGLVPVAAGATEALRRAREACFLDAALAKGLPKACGPLFAQLAGAEHVDAIIVMGPGRNDSTHGSRRRELPEYLRGWCFVSEARSEEDTADRAPLLLNLTELLLIGPAPPSAQVSAREWGGAQTQTWTGFKPPPDLKDIPEQQLSQLQPLFAAMLKQQASGVLEHLQVTR